jgi:hypothetical protein
MAPVEIAIIDSGVNPWHSHVGGVEEGIGLCIGEQGAVVESADFMDEIGHGTAIAGIVRGTAPAARLFAAKIFSKTLKAPMAVLVAALEWALRKNVKIIHLSLGTVHERYRATMEGLCQAAFDTGKILVAAAARPDAWIYPAVFPTVIGVYWNPACDEDALIYHPGNPVEFGAHGWPRALPGCPQGHNFRGSSFAAARVTARIARFIAVNPDAGCEEVKGVLASTARVERLQG